METQYKYCQLQLTLEDPATHIVTKSEISIRHFVNTLRTDISDAIIDLHEEVIYTPYKRPQEEGLTDDVA